MGNNDRARECRRKRTKFLGPWMAVGVLASVPVFAQDAARTASDEPSPAAIPDFSGIWSHPYLTGFKPPAHGAGPVTNTARRPDGGANFQNVAADREHPILKPQAAEIVRRHAELSLSGRGYETPSNQCWPGGVPYVFWDFLVQIFQAKDHVTLLYRQGDEVRHVRMNAAHPFDVKPSW